MAKKVAAGEGGRALVTKSGKKLTARRDTLDFRDQMYVPTLVEVPPERPLAQYQALEMAVLDQGEEGACTGFGLAAVANFLLRTRKVSPEKSAKVSPWMLYDLARRYDEWSGENYEGSSARGAMKGWHKHGVCALKLWTESEPGPGARRVPQDSRAWKDALARPLGAYFRVNHKDLVAMHAAITEVGVLYATADVHEGWEDVGANGIIEQSATITGGHAFAIVAYDTRGFWIQNSWGKSWGKEGFAHISYDDWLANASDVWVARLGAPVQLAAAESAARASGSAAKGSRAAAISDLQPHIVSIGNDGQLRPGGEYGTTVESLTQLMTTEIPEVFDRWKVEAPEKRPSLLLFAHGGLVSEESAVQKVAAYRAAVLAQHVYPVSFIWKTDYATTIKNIVQDALRRRRTEGVLDAAKDFMLDRLDDALEPIARIGTGKATWGEMKENAIRASASPDGGARLFLDRLEQLQQRYPTLAIHIVAHSAGSIFMAPVVERLARAGSKIATCTLWAPACTMDVFRDSYRPAIENAHIERFALYTLTDKAEQDDNCANIYHKSLLYLVSNAFEKEMHLPMFREGHPLLGMEKFVKRDKSLMALIRASKVEWCKSPNDVAEDEPGAARAVHHGDFDDDRATLLSTLHRITGVKLPAGAVTPGSTSEKRRNLRQGLVGANLAV